MNPLMKAGKVRHSLLVFKRKKFQAKEIPDKNDERYEKIIQTICARFGEFYRCSGEFEFIDDLETGCVAKRDMGSLATFPFIAWVIRKFV